MKTKAIYVSVWNGGLEITSPCLIDLSTKEVTNVEQVDTENMDLETLDREFIRLSDDTEIELFTYDGFEYVNGERDDD